MSDYIFLFDLDSTITQNEILPNLSEEIDISKQIRDITEQTMRGEIPFETSFRARVELLKSIPVSKVQSIIRNIPLNNQIVEFIQNNKERCYVITGNIDIWIHDLMVDLNLENNYFSSKAIQKDDMLVNVIDVLDKENVVKTFSKPYVAIGDGDNDAGMIRQADIGIGFGGVRPIATSVLNNATHAVYKEETLCRFLQQLL